LGKNVRKPQGGIFFTHTVHYESTPLPSAVCGFRTFFSKTVENFQSIFTHLLYVPIYARLQSFIQLSPTLTKLCHITVSAIHKMSTIGRNARVQTFAKVVDSFVDRCLWQVTPNLLLL